MLGAVLVGTELAFAGVSHFWGTHPFTTNLISGLVTILVGVLIVNRLLQHADSRKRTEVRWEVYKPFKNHLDRTLEQAEDLLRQYEIVEDDSGQADDQVERLNEDPDWIRHITPLVAEISQEQSKLNPTYTGAMLADPDLLEFATKYADVQRRMRHLHERLSKDATKAESARELLRAVREMREAKEVVVPQPAGHERSNHPQKDGRRHPALATWEPHSEGKGALWTTPQARTCRLETWNTIEGRPFHEEAMRSLGVQAERTVTFFGIEKDGTIVFYDGDSEQFGPIICKLDDRLKMPSSWDLR